MVLLGLAIAGRYGVAQNTQAAGLSPDLAQHLADAESSFDSSLAPIWFLGTFMEAADHGSAAAMRDVGLVNIGHDNELALSWFERAAVAGDARATSYIGDFYTDPENGEPEFKTARYWYEKSYSLQDSRGTYQLAEMSCKGQGRPVNHAECERLMADATKYFKASDPNETRLKLQKASMLIGDRYKNGTGTQVNLASAATWYDRAAVLGLTSAAVAEARLYVEKGRLPQNLVRAEAILDAIVAYQNKFLNPERGSFEDQEQVAAVYIETGQQYENRGPDAMLKAVSPYTKAAMLGNNSAAVKLGLRYVYGTGVAVNLDEAYTILIGLTQHPYYLNSFALADALDKLAAAYSAPRLQAANAARIQELRQAAVKERAPVQLAAAVMAPPPPPGQMVERYPNLIAPPTVPVQHEFTVNASLDAKSLGGNTQILSGQQQDGQLQITLPLGMTTMPIQVDLIAPGMTFVDGTSTGTIELDSTKPNSSVAQFKLRAGSNTGKAVLLATLSYHQNFIAELETDITVVAGDATGPAPVIAPGAPVVTDSPAPNVGAQPNNTTPKPLPASRTTLTAQQAQKRLNRANMTNVHTPPPALPPAGPIVLNPLEKTTDLTITETLAGDTMHYKFDSPGLPAPVDVDVPGAIAAKVQVEEYYATLEDQSQNLAQGSGADCAADRQKHIGGDSDPNCKLSVTVRGIVEGIGNDLYDKWTPKEFQTVYQQLTQNHMRLHTITVVSNSPTLPWELMRPKAADGSREFLGLTASIVHEYVTAPQLDQPANVTMKGISYIAPTYKGNMALPNSEIEVRGLKTYFPLAAPVQGNSTAVNTFLKNAPQGIIHYTGHGQRIAQKDIASPRILSAIDGVNANTAAAAVNQLTPEYAILLEDNSMTSSTFAAIREDGASTHPFYFFNACDLGRTDQLLNYVDGWAPSLMRSGASGYMGALYQVGDASATSFATHFYADLKVRLAGKTNWSVADVVTQARSQTYAESNDPTALAYVLYTKPFMKLVPGQ
jgi:TPR repeat protein